MDKINCPICKSNVVVKRGFFQTLTNEKQQRYFCKKCNKKFIEKTPFYRMRNTSQKITLCIDLFYRGISTRKIQEHLQSFYPHNSSWVSIYSWIIKYSKQISKFTDKLRVNIGSEIQVDEVEYFRRKSHKKKLGTDKNWFIDSICPKTKFMVASNYYKERSQANVKNLLKTIKEKSESQVKVITTDGWVAYPKAIRKIYGFSNKTHKVNVEHNLVNASKGDGFNYPIERMHNNIRARTKTFRGFHGSVNSANAIMKGYAIYYNFITKHQAINCCPYQLAIPTLQLSPENKWLQLIKLSSLQNNKTQQNK